MKNNLQTNTTTTQTTETIQEIKPLPPENCDVMLLNNDRVCFECVEDVLSEVLQIGRNQSMQIAMQAHVRGRQSVFMGPKDVAEQYQMALTEYARSRHDEETAGMGYDLITFQVEKSNPN